MLLGKDKREREKIFVDIRTAFTRRNEIVHGKETKIKEISTLLPDFVDYLRRSILRLIP